MSRTSESRFVRIPQDLYLEVATMAKEDDHSVASTVRTLVRAGLQRRMTTTKHMCERCAVALDESGDYAIYTNEGVGFLCRACWPKWERIVASQGIDGDDKPWPLSPAALERNNKRIKAAEARHGR
jgi:hypothetical protein